MYSHRLAIYRNSNAFPYQPHHVFIKIRSHTEGFVFTTKALTQYENCAIWREKVLG